MCHKSLKYEICVSSYKCERLIHSPPPIQTMPKLKRIFSFDVFPKEEIPYTTFTIVCKGGTMRRKILIASRYLLQQNRNTFLWEASDILGNVQNWASPKL